MTDSQNQQVEIGIQRIYTKDLSFESPGAPRVFMENVAPQIHLDVNTSSNRLDESVYEVVLTVTASAKSGDKVVFIAEVEQAGVFMIKGASAEARERILAAYCPNILFPYVRETIDSLTIKGSFPPLLLAPINFEALYLNQKSQQ